MEVTVKKVQAQEIKKAAEILSSTFVEDPGITALFPNEKIPQQQKVKDWFLATLKMQKRNQQLVWGAYQDKELIGLAVISEKGFNPSIPSLLQWTFSTFFSCGPKAIQQTILHDQARQKYLPTHPTLILEFIAVIPEKQGKGVGKIILEKLQNYAYKVKKSLWLETTRRPNIQIFEKSGFKLINSYQESGTEYFTMKIKR